MPIETAGSIPPAPEHSSVKALVLALLKDRSARECERLCKDIIEGGLQRCHAVLIELMHAKTTAAVQLVLRVLRALSTQKKVLPEIEIWRLLARTEDPALAAEALELVVAADDTQTAQALAYFYAHEQIAVRRRVLTRLLILNRPSLHCSQLGLKENDPTCVLQACRLAQRFPDTKLLDGLLHVIVSGDERSRNQAFTALRATHTGFALLAARYLQSPETARYPEAQNDLSSRSERQQQMMILALFEAWDEIWPEPHAAILFESLKACTSNTLDRLARLKKPHWLPKHLISIDRAGYCGKKDVLTRMLYWAEHEDEQVSAQAVDVLAELDRDDPGSILSQLLFCRNNQLCERALAALSRSGPLAIPQVRRFLSDPDPTIRKTAYEALRYLLPEQNLELCRRGLDDNEREIRQWAMQQLENRTDIEAQRLWIHAAGHKDPDLKARAIRLLILNEIVLPSLARAYQQTLLDILEARVTGFSLVEIEILVHVVARLGAHRFWGVLVAAARYRSAIVRRAAAEEILLRANRPQARECMAILSDTEDPDVLRRVAWVLASAGDARAVIPLLRALDEVPGSRKALEPFLENYPQIRKLRFLLLALKQPYSSIKRFALQGLLALESPEMIEPLLQATNDPDPQVRMGAMQALAKFVKHPEVYKRLIELREAGTDEALRQEAVATLLGMDGERVIPSLLEATRETDLEVQCGAVQALGKYAERPEVAARLIEMLEYGDIGMRETVVKTLGQFKVIAAVDALIRLLGNPFLSQRVREALFSIGNRKGILAIKRFEIRAKAYGKKKEKGAIRPLLNKKGKR